MTEAEWMACDDWLPMLMYLSGRLTRRKARLYSCAGLRQLWELLYDDNSREVVDVAERAADGAASTEEIQSAYFGAEVPTFGHDFDAAWVRRWAEEDGEYYSAARRLMEMGVYNEDDLRSDERLGDKRVRNRLLNLAHIAYHGCPVTEGGELNEHLLEHLLSEAEWPGGWLLREIVGNPFRPITVVPSWLTPSVVALSQAAYEERQLPAGTLNADRLAVLADALEDAGCTDADILGHLRGPGPHVRGCWPVDLLLGRC